MSFKEPIACLTVWFALERIALLLLMNSLIKGVENKEAPF